VISLSTTSSASSAQSRDRSHFALEERSNDLDVADAAGLIRFHQVEGVQVDAL
jgi:hypothetical protein